MSKAEELIDQYLGEASFTPDKGFKVYKRGQNPRYKKSPSKPDKVIDIKSVSSKDKKFVTDLIKLEQEYKYIFGRYMYLKDLSPRSDTEETEYQDVLGTKGTMLKKLSKLRGKAESSYADEELESIAYALGYDTRDLW